MNSKKQMHAQSQSVALRGARFAALAVLGLFGLAGCGGGAGTADNPVTDRPEGGFSYTGPVPATTDIQAFRAEFWEPALAEAGCDNCHNANGQSPQFLRTDDVNQAYQQANGIVNRESPSQSLMVTKVGGGHNCWKSDAVSCTAILTRWITAWVGASATGGKQIELIEPNPVDPGSSKRFPDVNAANMPALFTPVYEKLDEWCSECHQANSATAQSPYFAAGSFPLDSSAVSAAFKEAYLAAIPKINLDNPAMSRFVTRLRSERHNCFNDCATDAQQLEDLIEALAGQITPDPVPPGTLSKAVTLFDGTPASGGNRYENNVIALYEFKAGVGGTSAVGAVAADTSGVAPSADLNVSGEDVTWVGGFGLNIRKGKAQATTLGSRKFHQLITATGEYSIEAWVVPGNVTQEDTPIVSYSGSTMTRNFTMGQNLYNYEFANRSTATNADGAPRLATDDDAERLQASLQHVVMTFDPINGRRIYVNGEFTDDADGSGGGTLGAWNNSFAFVLGNEVSSNRQWQGVIRLVAIHNRALTLPQIKQNFDAGVGQKFFLLFGVSHLIDVPKSYIMFEATQYDTFGYLFTSPKFISLDPAAMPGTIPLQGMRIGLNGVETQVGQAYRLLNTAITNEQYSAATGQLLSRIGTIVPVERGPEQDQFFLCFDVLGTATNACSTYTAGTAPAPVLAPQASDIGVKTFDAINATMASITGVNPNNTKVSQTYASVRQSLPAVPDLAGFLSSHQTSIAQLALQYCNVMLDDPAARTAFFGAGANFSSTLGAGAERDVFVNALVNKMIGSVDSQPTVGSVQTELNNLIGSLCTPDPAIGRVACGGTRTISVLKAACGATLGNAATLVQ